MNIYGVKMEKGKRKKIVMGLLDLKIASFNENFLLFLHISFVFIMYMLKYLGTNVIVSACLNYKTIHFKTLLNIIMQQIIMIFLFRFGS